MQKFGLFDLIEKLSPLEKALKSIPTLSKKQPAETAKNPKNSQVNPPKIKSTAPYYLLIKKHEEISKRIDKNSKLNFPKN